MKFGEMFIEVSAEAAWSFKLSGKWHCVVGHRMHYHLTQLLCHILIICTIFMVYVVYFQRGICWKWFNYSVLL